MLRYRPALRDAPERRLAHRWVRTWVGAALVAGTAAAGASGSAADATAAAAAPASTFNGTHQLTQQVLALSTPGQAPVATLLGPTEANTPLSIDVSIDTQLAAKEAAVEGIYQPGNPTYHRYYTDASWDAQFAVPSSVYRPVVSYLTGYGMAVGYEDPAHDLVEFHATVAEANRAFDVQMQNWKLARSGRVFYANNVAPTVPAAVDAVQGLTNAGFVEKGKVTDQTTCAPDPAGAEQCVGGFEGSELRTIYDVGATNVGTGQALAVNGDGDTQGPTADLHKYEQDRSLPLVNTVFVNTNNGDCVASGPQPSDCDTSGEGEWALDSTSSTAMAPGANTIYYFFPSDLGDGTSFQAWADYDSTSNGPIPMQQNASWGECETLASSFLPVSDGTYTIYTASFVDAAGKGKTQFVSAGDTGSGCLPGQNGVTTSEPPDIEWPCSSSWVVCVGGTVIYSNGATGATEQRADIGGTCTPETNVDQPNECGELAWAYTGGGSSVYIPAQSWQTALPGTTLIGRCLVEPDGSPYTGEPPLCRGAPDVAALSGDISLLVNDESQAVLGSNPSGVDGNGFFDVEGGSPQTSSQASPEPGTETEDGGTSLSDPLWEGMWADANSAAPSGTAAGSDPPTWGFAAPALYTIGANATQDSCAFYNVQVAQAGSNFTYPAEPRTAIDPSGWSYTSGLGSPDLTCLEADLAANASPNPSVPEAPMAGAILLVGVAVAGWLLYRRRRRVVTV